MVADGSCSMAIPASGRGTAKRRARWMGGGLGREVKDDDRLVGDLYRQYYSPLMAFVLRLTAGDRQQAEDVVQETIVRAWRQGGSSPCPRPDCAVSWSAGWFRPQVMAYPATRRRC